MLTKIARIFFLVAAIITTLAFISPAPVGAQVQSCPGAPASRLVVTRDAYIPPGPPNNLRDKASKAGKVLTQVPGYAYVRVLDGPKCADNLAWWQVNFQDTVGWMAEGSGKNYFMNPTTSPITEFTVSGPGALVKYKNVSFIYSGTFSKKAQALTVLATPPPGPDENPYFQAGPEFIEFTFRDAPVEQYAFEPLLQIYPVDAYKKVNTMAAQQLPKLQTLLDRKSQKPTADIPVLPPVMAAQVFFSNLSYRGFGGGKGVRFFTMYAQDISPITSDRLIYLYQGLTDDGKYLVSVSFPVKCKLLADKFEDDKEFAAIDMGGNNTVEQYKTYLNNAIAKLNGAAASDFTPSLDSLDAVIQAITIQ